MTYFETFIHLQADVLVYAVHPSLDLKQGNISGVLDARAGPQLQAELKDSFKGRKLKPWEFTCTNGYKLPYKFVLHGALEEYKNFDSLKVLNVPVICSHCTPSDRE